MKNLTPEEIQFRILNDPDFIYLKRYRYSMALMLKKHPDGVPVRIIAKALRMTEEEISRIYQGAAAKIRDLIDIK